MHNLRKDNIFPFVILALYAIMLLVAYFIGQLLIPTISFTDPDLRNIRFGSYVNLIYYGSLFILFIILFLQSWKNTLRHFVSHSKKQIAIILGGVGFMYISMIVLGLLYQIIDVTTTPENQEMLNKQLNGPLFDKITLVLFAVFLAPLVEELVFRLSLLQIFNKLFHIPMWGAIVLSALAFGTMHVLGDDFVQIIYYAALGVILAIVYVRSNNILASITVHMLFNAFVTISMFLGT